MSKLIKIVTSGTGMERAARSFMGKSIDDVISESYTEILLTKRGVSKYLDAEYLNELDTSKNKRLFDFLTKAQKDKESCAKSLAYAPDINFYKLSLPEHHRNEIHKELTDDEMSGWSKILSDVDKNSAMLKLVIKGLWGQAGFKGKGIDNLEIKKCIGKEPKVVQFFVGCPTNKELDKLGKLFETCLPNHIIRVLSGTNDATNAKSEDIVKADIQKCKDESKEGVIVLSIGMAARSFSISETDAVVLLYDNGSVSSLVQKISRSLTGGLDFYGNPKTEGNVISLSFDPNRVDSVDLFIVEEAHKNRMEHESIQAVIRRIRQSINIFLIDDNGDKLNLLVRDEYYSELIEKFNFDRLKNSQIDLLPLFQDESLRNSLLDINASELSKATKKVKELKSKGKKFVDDGNGNSSDDSDDENLDKVDINLLRQAILTITNSLLSIVGIDGPISNIDKSFRQILKSIDSDLDKKKEFVGQYGITPGVVTQLLDKEVINEQIIDMCLSQF